MQQIVINCYRKMPAIKCDSLMVWQINWGGQMSRLPVTAKARLSRKAGPEMATGCSNLLLLFTNTQMESYHRHCSPRMPWEMIP